MKKMVLCIIPLIMAIMGCASSGSPTATAIAPVNTTPTATTVVPANSTSVVTTPGMDLDAAIKEAAAQMGANLPGETKVALVSIASSSAQFSEYVISRLEAAVVSGGKLIVVDRANLDRVREEQGFQLSGEVDDNSAKSIGKLLGAGAIVTGSFINLGDVYGLNLKAINMGTAAVAMSYPADIIKSTRIETLLASGSAPGGRAVTQTPAQAAPAKTAQPTVQPAPTQSVQVPAQPVPAQVEPTNTYKVGDKGPAGGLIFYPTTQAAAPPPPVTREYNVADTGPANGLVFYPASLVTIAPPPVNREYEIGDTGPGGGIIFYINPEAGEWKYLEAAPANTEKVTFWAAENFPSNEINNSRSVGTGKSNSSYIMRQAIDRGGGFDWAAEVCDSLVVNGYADWFLPSRDELHQMYGNLVRRGLGGFKGEWYWSSTAGSNEGTGAWIENFMDGSQTGEIYLGINRPSNRDKRNRVRAIRQF